MSNVIKGLTGSVMLPGNIGGKLNSVTLNAGRELADISGFGDGEYRVRTNLLKDISGTASGFLEEETNPGFTTSSDDPATMTLTFKSGYVLTFQAIIGSINCDVRYDGVVLCSFAFANAGSTPTLTWNGS